MDNKDKKYENDAEELVKASFGANVFEREEGAERGSLEEIDYAALKEKYKKGEIKKVDFFKEVEQRHKELGKEDKKEDIREKKETEEKREKHIAVKKEKAKVKEAKRQAIKRGTKDLADVAFGAGEEKNKKKKGEKNMSMEKPKTEEKIEGVALQEQEDLDVSRPNLLNARDFRKRFNQNMDYHVISKEDIKDFRNHILGSMESLKKDLTEARLKSGKNYLMMNGNIANILGQGEQAVIAQKFAAKIGDKLLLEKISTMDIRQFLKKYCNHELKDKNWEKYFTLSHMEEEKEKKDKKTETAEESQKAINEIGKEGESSKLLSQKEAAERRAEEMLGGGEKREEKEVTEKTATEKVEAGVEKLMTAEEILEAARGEFARMDLMAEKYIRAKKKFSKEKKTKADFEKDGGYGGKEYAEAKGRYFGTLKIQREKMLEDGTKKIETLNLPKGKKDKEMKKLLSEIVKETAARESGRLHDKKMELRLELRGGETKFEKVLNISKKVVEKYRKMPLKYKLMLSAGLLAGGVAAGAVGGAAGAAMVTGVVAGKWFQRVLGGSAAAVGIEGLIKRSQEKKTEKRVSAEFADMSIEAIKNNDEQLNKRLLELEGGKKREKYRRFALAGSVGALIMSGWTAKAFGAIIPDEWADWMKDKIGLGTEAAPTKEALMKSEIVSQGMGAEKVAGVGVGFVEVAEKGDSVWKMAEDQLEKHYGERFSDLDPAQKTYAIDAIKDKIAANPKIFGLDDIDKLKIGQKVDFSSIINDEKNLDNIFNHAEGLSQAALDNIEAGKGVVNIELGGSAGLMGESLGLSPEEYNAIKGVKVGKLLEQIPSKEKAWEVWRDIEKRIDLPHDGVYGVSEFNKHIKLAELIRNSGSVEGIENMTVAEALEKIQGSAGVSEATDVASIELGDAVEAPDMATGAGEAELWKGTPELEAADKAPGAGEAVERVANIELDESPAKEIKPISTEKVVESLTGRDKEIKDLLLGNRGVDNTINQLKTGKISSNEFTDFYTNNSEKVNSELYQKMKTSIEDLKSSDNIKSGKANRALKVILQRILAK